MSPWGLAGRDGEKISGSSGRREVGDPWGSSRHQNTQEAEVKSEEVEAAAIVWENLEVNDRETLSRGRRARASGKHVFKAETCVYSRRQKLRRRGNENAWERIITGPWASWMMSDSCDGNTSSPERRHLTLGRGWKSVPTMALADTWEETEPQWGEGTCPRSPDTVALGSKSA